MKRLSYWGRDHKWSARVIIVLATVLMNACILYAGFRLEQSGIILPSALFLLAMLVYLLGVLYYPEKNQRISIGAHRFYIRQKACDGIVLGAGLVMFLLIGNSPDPVKQYFSNGRTAAAMVPATYKDSQFSSKLKMMVAFANSMRDEHGNMKKWKERKVLLKKQLKQIREMSDGGKVGLIILSVLVAIGLLFLILGLACNLSCSGNDGAAVFVGVGGTVLIIFLLVLVIRGIYPGKRRLARREARKKLEAQQPKE